MDEQGSSPPRSPLGVYLRRLGIGLAVIAGVVVLGFAALSVIIPRQVRREEILFDRQMVWAIAETVHIYQIEHGSLPTSLLAVTNRRAGRWSPHPCDLSWWFEGEEVEGWEGRPFYAQGEGIIDRWGWPYLYSSGGEAGCCTVVAGRGPDGEWAVDDPLAVYGVPDAPPQGDDVLAQRRDGGWLIRQGDYRRELGYLSTDR